MRFENVLLLSPTYQGSFYEEPQPDPPIGLGYVAESLTRHKIDYNILDMTLGYTVEDVIGRVKSDGFDLIGFTMMSFKYKAVSKMISEIKRACPEVAIMIGGAHPSAWEKDALSVCADIDFSVVGEGEYTAVELCRGLPFKKIKGLVYREGNEIIFTGPRSFISDLDVLRFPRYEKFELHKYRKISINTSRGCPFRCIYCSSHLVLGRRWRPRSAQQVLSEVEYWYGKGIRLFGFTEDNFTFDRQRVYEICTGLKERGLTEASFEIGGIRADKIDHQLLKMMWSVGIRKIGIGVEGGNDRILKNLKKGENIQSIENAIRNACDLGFEVKLYFIIGSPTETWEDFMDSIRLAEKYPVKRVNFYSMMPIPHTELFEWVQKEGRLLESPEDYLNNDTPWSRTPFFDGPGMSLEEKRCAISMGTRVKRKIDARNLLRKKLGPLGVLLADVVHGCPPLYSLFYGKTFIRSAAKKLEKLF